MLRAENGRLREANERLRVLLEDKDAKIADLEKRLARVERLLSRNSGNSGMPPGTDDLPGKTPPAPEPRRGGGRKPGKQRGAPGAHLEWKEHPDDTQDVFPAGGCACGADLSGAADLGVRYSHQVDPGGLDRADALGGPGLGRLLQPPLADQAEAQQSRDMAEDPQVPVVLGCLAGGCGQRQGHLAGGEGEEPMGLRARRDLVHRQLAHRGDLLGAEDVHRGLDVCGPGPPPDLGGALEAVEHLEAHALGQASEHRDPAVTVDRALPGTPAAERGSRRPASTVPFLVVLFAQGRLAMTAPIGPTMTA